MTAMKNVIEGTAFPVEVTTLEMCTSSLKYMFRVKLTLQDQEKVES